MATWQRENCWLWWQNVAKPTLNLALVMFCRIFLFHFENNSTQMCYREFFSTCIKQNYSHFCDLLFWLFAVLTNFPALLFRAECDPQNFRSAVNCLKRESILKRYLFRICVIMVSQSLVWVVGVLYGYILTKGYCLFYSIRWKCSIRCRIVIDSLLLNTDNQWSFLFGNLPRQFLYSWYLSPIESIKRISNFSPFCFCNAIIVDVPFNYIFLLNFQCCPPESVIGRSVRLRILRNPVWFHYFSLSMHILEWAFVACLLLARHTAQFDGNKEEEDSVQCPKQSFSVWGTLEELEAGESAVYQWVSVTSPCRGFLLGRRLALIWRAREKLRWRGKWQKSVPGKKGSSSNVHPIYLCSMLDRERLGWPMTSRAPGQSLNPRFQDQLWFKVKCWGHSATRVQAGILTSDAISSYCGPTWVNLYDNQARLAAFNVRLVAYTNFDTMWKKCTFNSLALFFLESAYFCYQRILPFMQSIHFDDLCDCARVYPKQTICFLSSTVHSQFSV